MSGVRRGNGRHGGGLGGGSDGGGASAAAKTSGLGHDDKMPAEALMVKTWVLREDPLSLHEGRVVLVDSAREKNKARAVVEIYRILLNRGRYRGMHPF